MNSKLVIEVGEAVVRLGWNSIPVPVRTRGIRAFAQATSQEVKHWLHDELLPILHSKPNAAEVVLVANVLSPPRILQAIADCLTKQFSVSQIEVLPAVALPLSLTGVSTGVVIQCGFSPTEILPMFQGFPYPSSLTYCPLSLRSLIESTAGKPLQLSDEELSTMARGVYSNAQIEVSGRRLKVQWRKLLFGDYEEQQPNLAYSLLSSLSNLPLPAVQRMAKNVVLSGSLWRIKGLRVEFARQVQAIRGQPQFKNLWQVKFRLAELRGFKQQERAFAGACAVSQFGKVGGLAVGAGESVDVLGRRFFGLSE